MFRVQISYRKQDGSFSKVSGGDFKTAREAKEAEAVLLCRFKGKSVNKITVAEVARSYLAFTSGLLKTSTRIHAADNLRIHIIPYFGNLPLISVTSIQIQHWKNVLASEKSEKTGIGYSPSYLATIWKTLHVLFNYAKRKLHIENHAVDDVGGFRKDPDAISKEKPLKYWTAEQLESFQKAFSGLLTTMNESNREFILCHGVRLICSIAAYAGLRKGEANSLRVSDFHDGRYPFLRIDSSISEKSNGSVSLDKNQSERKDRGYMDTCPKNVSSTRDVQIPKILSMMIKDQIELLKRVPGCENNPFLCGGVYPLADTTIENYKNEVERLAGLPHIRFHDLRHTYVSMLINAEVPINVISRMVGHSSPEITWKVYSHIYPKSESVAVDALEKMIK